MPYSLKYVESDVCADTVELSYDRFSSCPVSKSKLVFQWSLQSAPATSTVDAGMFTVTSSQLYIPSGRLEAGSTYRLDVKAFLSDDPSKQSQVSYEVQVKRRSLVAHVRGGAMMTASTSRSLVLDASRSKDPDIDGFDDALRFFWTCSITDQQGYVDACRFKNGTAIDEFLEQLPIATVSREILQDMYPTFSTPYVFQVEVRKGTRSPATFSMPVVLVERRIPAVSIDVSDGALQQEDGTLLINANEQLVVVSSCVQPDHVAQAQSNQTQTWGAMRLRWRFYPDIKEEQLEITDASVSEQSSVGHVRERLLVAASSGAFEASQYRVHVECTDGFGEMASASLELTINEPPIGEGCSACRLEKGACALDEPSGGEPIFDTFRFSCVRFTDAHLPLQYQYRYIVEGSNAEVIFDWSTEPLKDVILPAGIVTVKSRVRDSLGGGTGWMAAGQLSVGDVPFTNESGVPTSNNYDYEAEEKLLEAIVQPYAQVSLNLVGCLFDI